ncbi:unnamed protein product [Amaranthus hypochondriacus]
MIESGAEWSSFNGANSVNEEANFMAQLFPNCALDNSDELESLSGMTGLFYPTDLSQGSCTYSTSSSTSSMVAYPFQGTYCLSHAYEFFPVECCPTDSPHEGLNLEMIGGRKRPRILEEDKRNIRTKKNQKNCSNDVNEDNNGRETNRYNLVNYSEEECNGSQELNGVVSSSLSSRETSTINLNGKTRASRGAATDPQSLYARKRRERINERLRMLQNLVPNGTKVDISTMLEEAVQYVKFLQLQIKLLSSDELWMYAPLAYNGMDVGLIDSKI